MRGVSLLFIVVACGLAFAAHAHAQARRCPADSVKIGTACVDKYEASVWSIPDPTGTNSSLVKKIVKGKFTLADLLDAGAQPVGCNFAPANLNAYPSEFPRDGNWTTLPGASPPTPGVYAVSLPGVFPSGCTSWFRAAQACRLSGKRLLTNEEWQAAAAGTPDPGAADDGTSTCATNSTLVQTGGRSQCVSAWGVYDMVGNVTEWVSQWGDLNDTACTDWSSTLGVSDGDRSCVGGTASTAIARLPGAAFRGGSWLDGVDAGVFSITQTAAPYFEAGNFGFRCAR